MCSDFNHPSILLERELEMSLERPGKSSLNPFVGLSDKNDHIELLNPNQTQKRFFSLFFCHNIKAAISSRQCDANSLHSNDPW